MRELKQLHERICPKYKEIVSDIKTEKASLETQYEKLTRAVSKARENWQREIEAIANKRISEISEMKAKHMTILNEQEKDITHLISEINRHILEVQETLNSSDDSLSTTFKTKTAEFRRLPPKLKISLPCFFPQSVYAQNFDQLFGSLSALSTTEEEQGYITAKAVSSFPSKQLLDKPEIIFNMDTGYKTLKYISCLNDEEIWTHQNDNIMRLYNLQGALKKSIRTKSGNVPDDIAVTKHGELLYIDYRTSTLNTVKNKQVQKLIRFRGWKPYNVCSSSTGDFLVMLQSHILRESKVVCYSGSTEKRTIQFDDMSKPLYTYDQYSCNPMCENGNFDICVLESVANALVVVTQTGKLRFKYTGNHSSSKGPSYFTGLTTDSHNQILIADEANKCIHILDQDGHFLRYIDNCHLYEPECLCVDTKDNLFVAEANGEIKIIKYMQRQS